MRVKRRDKNTNIQEYQVDGWMDGLPYIVVRMSMIGYHMKLPFIQQRIFDIQRFPAIKLLQISYRRKRIQTEVSYPYNTPSSDITNDASSR